MRQKQFIVDVLPVKYKMAHTKGGVTVKELTFFFKKKYLIFDIKSITNIKV